MKKYKSIVSIMSICLILVLSVSLVGFGLNKVNGYCESGDWNPLKKDRGKTDAYGLVEQKLTATAKIQYYDEQDHMYKTFKTITATKDYGDSPNYVDTDWVECTLDDGYNIRNNYSGAIYNSGGQLDYSTSGYVYE